MKLFAALAFGAPVLTAAVAVAAQMFVVAADGRGGRRLTRGAGASWPARAPDGRRIAYTEGRDLFTVTVGSRRLTRLTRSQRPWIANLTPAYSPDGRTIAFSRSTDAFNNDLFLMRADGSKLRRLTKHSGNRFEARRGARAGVVPRRPHHRVRLEPRGQMRADGRFVRDLGRGTAADWR